MSEEWIQKMFNSIGLNKTEIQIYIYLLKEGDKKALEISKALNLYKQQLYRSLKKMERRSVIKSFGHPAYFSAVSFDNLLDLVIKMNLEEAKHIIQKKEKLLSGWRSIIKKKITTVEHPFKILKRT